MPLGNVLMGGQQMPIHPALAQSMAPQAVAQGGQASQNQLGMMMQKLQQNPAAIQALLNAGANLLNPTSFGSPGGRIASAVAGGLDDYSTRKTAAEDAAFKKEQFLRGQDREDRKVDLSERGVDLNEKELEEAASQFDTKTEQWFEEFGLKEEELKAQKDLWAAQAERYRADAAALKAKSEAGGSDNLTGPERIQNKIADILMRADVPEDRAYIMAFDIYNKSDQDRAKAIAGTYESMGMFANTEKGQKILDKITGEINATFSSATDVYDQAVGDVKEVAPGVTQGDIKQALDATNANSGTNLTWEQLTPLQRDRLIKQIQEYKRGQEGG